MIFYKPVYDDQGVRIPRYALEGLGGNGLGQIDGADAALAEIIRKLSTDAGTARSMVAKLGVRINHGEASMSDVDRVRGYVTRFSQEVGRYMPILRKAPPSVASRLDTTRRKLLPEMQIIQTNWDRNYQLGASASSRLATSLGIMAQDLGTAATAVGKATAAAVAAVGGGVVSVVDGAGSALRNMGAGLGVGAALLPLGLLGAGLVIFMMYGKKSKRAR